MTQAPTLRGEPARRLAALGLALPRVPAPRGAFLPFSRIGTTLWLAGQICEWEGEVRFTGPVTDIATGQEAARICALNLLASLSLALDGDLDRVVRCHRLGGFVQVKQGWPDVPKAVNGASDLMAELFGEAGRHARTAIGVASLPANASVEVDGIFEVR
ncbi:Enamine deaminase RidA, house cleaning of reactive enamine intermediates, YjgF/YER057c/UK114 family [Methylobacterium sp. 174MFSha1.1]|uniref:RidA family protein n=1 Tax=Methylobacterium sp. 174MFSha1.1 TaxID=1502749 RepID=UPI0008F0D951|nr:RidA family protein [Methylobacterium sp. 174MFSha1.1]SFU56973.1 Enamine deaminase RidA, house cleaning of reactive enamine intermediates, YjgF/YER057c/UK114 family [Methylobacterium sp. 174MFSha1.1]